MLEDRVPNTPRRGRFQNGSYNLSEPVSCSINIVNKFGNFRPFDSAQIRKEVQLSSLPVVPKILYDLFTSKISNLSLPSSGIVGYTTNLKNGKTTQSIGLLKSMQDIVKLCCIWSGNGWSDNGISFWIECGDEVISRADTSSGRKQQISDRTDTHTKAEISEKGSRSFTNPVATEELPLSLIVTSSPTDDAAIDVAAQVEVPTSFLRKPVVLFVDRPLESESLPPRLRVSLGFSTRSPLTNTTHTSLAYTIARNIETGENMNYPLSLLLNTSSRPASLCSLSRNAGLKPTVKIYNKAVDEQEQEQEQGRSIANKAVRSTPQAWEKPKPVAEETRSIRLSEDIPLKVPQSATNIHARDIPSNLSRKQNENKSSRGDLVLSGPSPWAEINVDDFKIDVDKTVSREQLSTTRGPKEPRRANAEPMHSAHETRENLMHWTHEKQSNGSTNNGRVTRSVQGTSVPSKGLFSSRLHPELSCAPMFDLSPSSKRTSLPLRGSDRSRHMDARGEAILSGSAQTATDASGKRKRYEVDNESNKIVEDGLPLTLPSKKKLKDQNILDDLVRKMLASCEEIARRSPPDQPNAPSKDELMLTTPSPGNLQRSDISNSKDFNGPRSSLSGPASSPGATHFATSDLSALRQRLLRSRMSLRVESSQYGDDFSPFPNKVVSDIGDKEAVNSETDFRQPTPRRADASSEAVLRHPSPRRADVNSETILRQPTPKRAENFHFATEKNIISERNFTESGGVTDRNADEKIRIQHDSESNMDHLAYPEVGSADDELSIELPSRNHHDSLESERPPVMSGRNSDALRKETRQRDNSSTFPREEQSYSDRLRRPSFTSLDCDRVPSKGYRGAQDNRSSKDISSPESYRRRKDISSPEGYRARKDISSPEAYSSSRSGPNFDTQKRGAESFNDESKNSSKSLNELIGRNRPRERLQETTLSGRRETDSSLADRISSTSRDRPFQSKPRDLSGPDPSLRSRLSGKASSLSGHRQTSSHPETSFSGSAIDRLRPRSEREQNSDFALRSRVGLNRSSDHGLSSSLGVSESRNRGGSSPFSERHTLRARLAGQVDSSRHEREDLNDRETQTETHEKPHSLPRRTTSLQDLRRRKAETSPYSRDQDSRSRGAGSSSLSSLRARLSDRRRSPLRIR